MVRRKLVYLAHKFGREWWRVEEIKNFIYGYYQEHNDVIFVSSVLLFGYCDFMDEREARKKSVELLLACDEVWVYVFSKEDFFTSKGLRLELRVARLAGKPVRVVSTHQAGAWQV